MLQITAIQSLLKIISYSGLLIMVLKTDILQAILLNYSLKNAILMGVN